MPAIWSSLLLLLLMLCVPLLAWHEARFLRNATRIPIRFSILTISTALTSSSTTYRGYMTQHKLSRIIFIFHSITERDINIKFYTVQHRVFFYLIKNSQFYLTLASQFLTLQLTWSPLSLAIPIFLFLFRKKIQK